VRSDALGMFWYDEPVIKIPKPPPEKKKPPERTWESPDYLPGLAEAKAFPWALYTFNEMLQAQGEELLFDIECYRNYFLCAFMSYKTGKVAYVEQTQTNPFTPDQLLSLQWITNCFQLTTFNGKGYDMPVLSAALAGKDCHTLKDITNRIIVYQERPQDILRAHKVKMAKANHVDLMEVAPLRGSLKIYGGRLHVPKMQDLPFHPEVELSADQMAIVRWYCVNDLVSTGFLRKGLDEELALRVSLSNEFGQDLRSRSDAQIAEYVIADEVGKLNYARPKPPEIAIGTTYHYKVPDFVRFETPLMNWVLDVVRTAPFIVDHTGSVAMPKAIAELKIKLGEASYQMGIGGLHSTESRVAHHAGTEYVLEDRDVTSYYPAIILNQGLYPEHLGPNFLKVYRGLVNRRIAAKRAGHKTIADSLKIVANGSFGKLGSQFSVLYAPDLLIQTTITGQLALLMFIERFELVGIPVVSANTDGIVIKCPVDRQPEMRDIIRGWELDTNFETEGTNYKSLYSKDVNNYIAVLVEPKKGQYTKTKGAYGPTGLKKNPTNQIVSDAVETLLVKGIALATTIYECKDIRKFVQVRHVKGGAVKNGEYLGKAIRWYYASGEEGDIIYASNGHSVPRSTGAKPLMQLPAEFPKDVDYQRYLDEAEEVLKVIGYYG
jgi:hypothetical protein